MLGEILHNPLIMKSRGGQIRTDDFLLPKQALYQAELRPEARETLWESATRCKNFFAQSEIRPVRLTGSPPKPMVGRRQGCPAIPGLRFSGARKRTFEPDAGHAAVGSRGHTLDLPRSRITRTTDFVVFFPPQLPIP